MTADRSRGHDEERELLAVIPARGGSKGIPRKNMKMLGGRPLIAYTVDAIVNSGTSSRLVISSDDEETLAWAQIRGHEVDRRPSELASEVATISDVAAYLADKLDWRDDVGVFQPTSPFRKSDSVSKALKVFRSEDVDSLASAVRQSHLYWRDVAGNLKEAEPLFLERANRQYARHQVLLETGAIQLVRATALRESRQMVTDRHMLFEMDPEESLDIDTPDDFAVAKRHLNSETIIFRLRANSTIGSGHIYHCLQLAEELDDHTLKFLLQDCEPFVERLLIERGYEYLHERDLVRDLVALAGPGINLIVNDILDTQEEEVLIQKAAGFKVVNVEDLGPGTRYADWVVNALYPVEENRHGTVSGGPAYATLRPEFHDLPEKIIREAPERVLITFGGTDPTHLAQRCATILNGQIDAEIKVVLGPAATEVTFPKEVSVARDVKSMAGEMMSADIVLTSAGRTVYEAAASGTPVVVVAQNAREATHAHLTYDVGVVFLGVGRLVDDALILRVVQQLLKDAALRSELSERLRRSIDLRGTERITSRMRQLLRGL